MKIFLTNLSNLLKSPPDNISPLSGKDLVKKKVNRFVSMAGRFPEGREFNVHMDSTASEYVFQNWPGEIVLTGFEIGWEIRTGLRLIKSDIKNSPVKDVFSISIPKSEEDTEGKHIYVKQKMPVEDMARFIEDRMMHQPDNK